jgi:Transposase DDE domain
LTAPARAIKHHLLVDAAGIPLAISLTGGHRNDVPQLLALVDRAEPIHGKPGRPRLRAETLVADRGCDHDKYRRALWSRGVKPVIAPRDGARLRAGQAAPGRRAHLRRAAPVARRRHTGRLSIADRRRPSYGYGR